ncbi:MULTISPECIES: LPS O-antigen chain length determinant protein WzzB [Pseudomonas putida group]|uniref:LPS O-antigen chain length determinant protein WzzB n=1 Tax=Pseudomonas putida group TaxID=136845 RepID=UPI0008637DD8|nr:MULTISPECIES: Wzz/FepE/Etk N-terminal domain-containing protein [Pseudomonas putida group]MCL8308518.1 Wzz/FepE/Etk N-terminal domain-containing protein [Pseudomonas putida]
MRNERERLNDSDEIDLLELIEGLWKRKVLIAVTTAVMTGLAVAYALLATPIYEAKVFVQPPTQNDIAQLNYGRRGSDALKPFTIRDVSTIYFRNLQSEYLRREFFRKVYLPSLSDDERKGSQDMLYKRFGEVLTVGASKDSPGRFYVIASLPDPQLAAQWAVRYVDLAGELAKQEIIKDARADVMIKADNLQQLIESSRESAQKQREDQIVRASEALRIARSIGLEKPPIISNEVAASMDGPLAYMRGSKALEAEINNLRSRPSDDPFIKNLRERQESLSFYRSLQIDPSVVQVYRQDGALESPDRPVKPRKLMIVVAGGGLGMLLGVFLALVANWRRAQRN